MPNGSVHEV